MPSVSQKRRDLSNMILQSSKLYTPVLNADFTSFRMDREEHPDSGVESSDESVTIDSQTLDAIVSQVESYFSADNLRKDAFLLKHVKRNRDGYVSLKLIASLRRIKSLTKSWTDVASAVRQKSHALILNEEGTKVKRAAALPLDLLLSSRGKRIVLAHGLPTTITTAADIIQSFAGHGNIVSVRLLAQEDDATITKTYPDLHLASSALIEYESAAAADKAVQSIQSKLTSWRSSLGAVLFGEPIRSRSSLTQSRNLSQSAERGRTAETGRQRSRTVWADSHNEESFPLRQKSHSYNGFDAAEFRRANIRSEIALHRQPLGPDGSRGFHKDRLTAI